MGRGGEALYLRMLLGFVIMVSNASQRSGSLPRRIDVVGIGGCFTLATRCSSLLIPAEGLMFCSLMSKSLHNDAMEEV